MNNRTVNIKQITQVILGIGLLFIHIATKSGVGITKDNDNTNWNDPATELFINFVHWAALINSIALLLLGIIGTIKQILSK